MHTNGKLVTGDLELARTKAIVEGMKAYIDKRLEDLTSKVENDHRIKALSERIAELHPGIITHLGPTINFPAEQLAKILSGEFAKAIGQISWPQQLEPQVTNEISPTPITIDNVAVAKAVQDMAQVFKSMPPPNVEAIDLSPLWDLVKGVNEAQNRTTKAIEANTKALVELGKAIKDRPKRKFRFDGDDKVVEE